jgi:hypothetical protein
MEISRERKMQWPLWLVSCPGRAPSTVSLLDVVFEAALVEALTA